jgi:hypothetical protein
LVVSFASAGERFWLTLVSERNPGKHKKQGNRQNIQTFIFLLSLAKQAAARIPNAPYVSVVLVCFNNFQLDSLQKWQREFHSYITGLY